MTIAGIETPSPAKQGCFAENLLRFAHLLRGAGLPIGSAKVIDAMRALNFIDIGKREDFYWSLASIFLGDKEHRLLFDEAFAAFWRDSSGDLLKGIAAPRESKAEAFPDQSIGNAAIADSDKGRARQPVITHVAEFSYSSREALKKKDFAALSEMELNEAKGMLERMALTLEAKATRRWRASRKGARIDWRATVRASLNGKAAEIKRRNPVKRAPPLVAICDISGSMDRYTPVFLHFLHGLYGNHHRVHAFLFGTRLSNVTRQLARRDAYFALGEISRAVNDWSGGTRIGASLHAFNRDWSRRVLGRDAVVLLVTDGLDRDDGEVLQREAERLHKSCARLIWLNPLLRYEQFAPKASGIRALLPHVDDFLPMHNVDSFLQLTTLLGRK